MIQQDIKTPIPHETPCAIVSSCIMRIKNTTNLTVTATHWNKNAQAPKTPGMINPAMKTCSISIVLPYFVSYYFR
eukprot:4932940-Amphidinium_carterae.1